MTCFRSATTPTFAIVLFSMTVSCQQPSSMDTAEEYYQQGTKALKENDFDKAIACFSAAIRLEPKISDCYVSRGFAYHQKKAYDKAIADFDQAIQLDPKDELAFTNRGNSYIEKK